MFVLLFFFFNDTATTEIYTLSLHDALPIFTLPTIRPAVVVVLTTIAIATLKVFDIVRTMTGGQFGTSVVANEFYSQSFRSNKDRKSTRLNSSHANISYAVFCLKKKKNTHNTFQRHRVSIRPATVPRHDLHPLHCVSMTRCDELRSFSLSCQVSICPPFNKPASP